VSSRSCSASASHGCRTPEGTPGPGHHARDLWDLEPLPPAHAHLLDQLMALRMTTGATSRLADVARQTWKLAACVLCISKKLMNAKVSMTTNKWKFPFAHELGSALRHPTRARRAPWGRNGPGVPASEKAIIRSTPPARRWRCCKAIEGAAALDDGQRPAASPAG